MRDKKPHGYNLRKGRYSEARRIYLITTVTHERVPYFRDFDTGRLLVGALRSEMLRADTLAYVVMPDHLHWLMQLHEGYSLPRVVADIKSVSAHHINRKLGRVGKFWQAGYHDHALREDEDVAMMARYVVANPLRAGLVSSLREYPLWDAVWV